MLVLTRRVSVLVLTRRLSEVPEAGHRTSYFILRGYFMNVS